VGKGLKALVALDEAVDIEDGVVDDGSTVGVAVTEIGVDVLGTDTGVELEIDETDESVTDVGEAVDVLQTRRQCGAHLYAAGITHTGSTKQRPGSWNPPKVHEGGQGFVRTGTWKTPAPLV
jgi:hypothetical protein